MDTSPSTRRRRRRLPPSKVDCKWWKKGHCRRGDDCFFRHAGPLRGVDSGAAATKKEDAQVKGGDSSSASSSSPSNDDAAKCGICLELPARYGLLPDCDHVFCFTCIRSWRSSNQDEIQGPYYTQSDNPDTDTDADTDTESQQDNTKQCPMCRTRSDFIVSSSVFPSPPSQSDSLEPPAEDDEETEQHKDRQPKPKNKNKNPAKEKIISDHLARLKSIPCRYFQKSVSEWLERHASGADYKPFLPVCFFANGCHYGHTDPRTGKPFVFSTAELRQVDAIQRETHDRARSMEIYREENAFVVQGVMFDSSNHEGGADSDEWVDTDDDDDDDVDDDENYSSVCDDALIPVPGALPLLL